MTLTAIALIVLATRSSDPAHPQHHFLSKHHQVKTFSVETTLTPTSLAIAGFVQGSQRADIAPAASGRVARLYKHKGETVKPGELLATLSGVTAGAQVSAAAAQVAALTQTLADSERYQKQLVDQSRDNITATHESIQSAKRARDFNIQLIQDQLTTAQGALAIISDPVWEGLAWVIIFGLSSSTLLNLVIFPLLYQTFEGKKWPTKE